MRKSFKTALCTILGICIIAAVLVGCAQTGNERALGPNGANNGYNNGTNYGAQNQGFNRNNLVGGRYGTNRNTGYTGITGTNRNTGYTGITGSNRNTGNTGYTGYNGMFGISRRNMAGTDGNTGNDPSNFLSYNGVNTIEYNNRYGRMGNYGTGAGYNGMLTGNNGYGNGYGYGSGYNGMLTGNNGYGNGYGYGSGYNGMLAGNNGYASGYGSGYNGMLTGTAGSNAMNSNDRVRATMIERRLNNVNGINDCSVIVSGDRALVGLKTNGTNAGNMSRLRTSIERRVKQMDSSIKNVTVTDSPQMLTRMGRLGTTGNNNATTTNFMQEFDNMVNSIGNAGR